MTKSDIELSVIICGHSGTDDGDLTEAVDSAISQEYPEMEVVVVISDSDELYARMADMYADESAVTVEHQPVDRGLSEARNYGADAATGNVYAFIDADAVLSEEWGERIAHQYTSHNALAVGGPASPRWSTGDEAEWLPEEMYWLVGCTERGFEQRVEKDQNGAVRTRNTYGCNITFRADAFEQLGGFNPEYGKSGNLIQSEETLLCEQLSREFGEEVVYAPQAGVDHKVDQSQLEVDHLMRRSWWQGKSKARLEEEFPGTISDEKQFLWTVLRGIAREVGELRNETRKKNLQRAGMLVILTVATVFGYGVEKVNSV